MTFVVIKILQLLHADKDVSIPHTDNITLSLHILLFRFVALLLSGQEKESTAWLRTVNTTKILKESVLMAGFELG